MNAKRSCPFRDRVQAMLRGDLSEDQHSVVASHLEDCGECQCCFEKMASEESIVSQAARAHSQENRKADTTLKHVLKSLHAEIPVKSSEGDKSTTDDELSLDFLEPSDNSRNLGRLGPYEIMEVIGRGGMGVVLKGQDTRLGRFVAIKVLNPRLTTSATARKRFRRESRAASGGSHDHVVTIHAVEEVGGLPVLVMEYVRGTSLQERISENGPLELEEIVRVGMQTASGLAAAHAQGLVHRDIKPSNILVEDGVERVKISDFGLARAADDVHLTQSGVLAGTPEYMSPEQARGEQVDYRTDLFSLGSLLYSVATGRSPFRAETSVAALRRVCEDTPRRIDEINAEIPHWLAKVIDKLVAKNPNDRFQSALEVSGLLGDYLAHLQQPSVIPKPPVPAPPGSDVGIRQITTLRRRQLWMVIIATSLLLGVALGISETTGVTNVASTVIRLVQGEGTLVIEVDDPSIAVTIAGEEIVIAGAGVNEIHLRPGQYELQAHRDGDTVRTRLITIIRGDRQIVQLSREPPVAAIRKVWADAAAVTGAISPDGRYLTYVDWETGDLAVRDLDRKKNFRLTNKGSWAESNEFAFDGGAAFSHDSKRIAYIWLNNEKLFELRTIAVDGTTPRVVYSNKDVSPQLADWSPDGKHLLAAFYTKDIHQIVMVAVEDGSVSVVKSLDRRSPNNLSLSPDGRYIIYDFPPREDSTQRDIFLLPVDGSREIPLVEDTADDTVLGWAPDGRRILFASDRRGTRDAWLLHVTEGRPQGPPVLINPDIGSFAALWPIGLTQRGSYYYGILTRSENVYIASVDQKSGRVVEPPVLVSPAMVGSMSPNWSPDGQYLAYLTWERGGRNTITIHTLETGAKRQLPTQLGSIFLKGARWSPDSRFFIVDGTDRAGLKGIYQINAQNGEVNAIVQGGPGAYRYQQPEWTPDGQVVFVSRTEAANRVVIRDLKSGLQKETVLTTERGAYAFIALSPDGQLVAFATGDNLVLKVMPVTGGEARELFQVGPPEMISEFTWTPDGRHVIFRKTRRQNGRPEPGGIWRIPAEGGQPQVVDLEMKGLRFLRVHPDGRSIAFTASPQEKSEVWVMENFLPPLPADRDSN